MLNVCDNTRSSRHTERQAVESVCYFSENIGSEEFSDILKDATFSRTCRSQLPGEQEWNPGLLTALSISSSSPFVPCCHQILLSISARRPDSFSQLCPLLVRQKYTCPLTGLTLTFVCTHVGTITCMHTCTHPRGTFVAESTKISITIWEARPPLLTPSVSSGTSLTSASSLASTPIPPFSKSVFCHVDHQELLHCNVQTPPSGMAHHAPRLLRCLHTPSNLQPLFLYEQEAVTSLTELLRNRHVAGVTEEPNCNLVYFTLI